MRKSIPIILIAALFAAPAAFAQSADQNSATGKGLTVKPSADTPARQKDRNHDYSKVPGKPGGKSGPAEHPNR